MAKKKKNNRNKADRVRGSRATKEKKLNPFDLKINKQKHSVLGRNTLRGQVGNPGQSRTKAHKQRCKTLLVELERSKKSNRFKDKRLGEGASALSEDEKIIQRLALERKLQQQRQSGEGEDMQLTHRGQTLLDMDQFEDIDPDSDDDDNVDGRLTGKMVDEHFGGLMTRKTDTDQVSWKDRMEQMIAQSKKDKYERQSEKDETRDLTDQLNMECRTVKQYTKEHFLLTTGKTDLKPEAKKKEARKPTSAAVNYDEMSFTFNMLQKGDPTDRLKTEEEKAKDEAERLKKLEEDRKKRMMGELMDAGKSSHVSADSLDDGFALDDSHSNKRVSFHGDGAESDTDEKDKESEAEEGEADNSDDDKESGDDDDDDNESGESNDDESDDNYSDLQSEEEEAEEMTDKMVAELLQMKVDLKSVLKKFESKECDEIAEDPKKTSKTVESKPVSNSKKDTRSILKKTDKTVDLEVKRKLFEAAKKEIPYTFEAPPDLESLVWLLSKYCVDDQVTVVERLVTCHHPSLHQDNRQKLASLFSLLLQYCLDGAGGDSPECYVKLLDKLTPTLWQLLKHDPQQGTAAVKRLLMDRNAEFQQICERRSGRGRYMGLDTMLLFKLIQVLYSTSDFRHEVVTPAVYFMLDMLGKSPVQTVKDVAAGLFLSAVLYKCVSVSKRYVPEVLKFLHGVLFLASFKDPQRVEKVFPPFKPVGFLINLLLPKEDVTEIKPLPVCKILAANVERQQLETDEFRVSCVSAAVHLLRDFSDLWVDKPAAAEIFAPTWNMLSALPTHYYPEGLEQSIRHLRDRLVKDACQPRKGLTLEKEKVQPMKLLEPKIDDVFDGRKKRQGTPQERERQRLTHKIKKEKKGALREIRKDQQFLARQMHKDTLTKDAERKRKVAKLNADIAAELGEVRAIKRQKDRA